MDTLEQILQIASETKGKVDLLVAQGAVQDDRHMKLDARVRAVENKQWWMTGVAAGLSAVATYVVKGWTGHP